VRCQVTEPELAQELCKALNGISAHTNRADHWYDQARESIDKKSRNQKAGNDLRAFRWGADADHPDVIYLHPTLSFANKAGESGRMPKT